MINDDSFYDNSGDGSNDDDGGVSNDDDKEGEHSRRQFEH
jgi:hypothetical protein